MFSSTKILGSINYHWKTSSLEWLNSFQSKRGNTDGRHKLLISLRMRFLKLVNVRQQQNSKWQIFGPPFILIQWLFLFLFCQFAQSIWRNGCVMFHSESLALTFYVGLILRNYNNILFIVFNSCYLNKGLVFIYCVFWCNQSNGPVKDWFRSFQFLLTSPLIAAQVI